jgi:hypothetical protein
MLLIQNRLLIYGSSAKEMSDGVERCLQKLREAKLKCILADCKFLQPEITYMGHVIGAAGIKTNPDKIKPVRNWPQPTTDKELRSFLGLASYYRRFVKDFAKVAGPLHDVLEPISREGRKWKSMKGREKKLEEGASEGTEYRAKPFEERWNPGATEAFVTLKRMLTQTPVLGYPDFTKPLILETDASLEGLGAVLS